jgi:Pyruvate/2-oxoacid:ferredoxin oxidoreductase delta subunit
VPPLNFSKTAFWLSGWWGHSGLRRMPRGKQD